MDRSSTRRWWKILLNLSLIDWSDGEAFADNTGIVHDQVGFYFILPTTNTTRMEISLPPMISYR